MEALSVCVEEEVCVTDGFFYVVKKITEAFWLLFGKSKVADEEKDESESKRKEESRAPPLGVKVAERIAIKGSLGS